MTFKLGSTDINQLYLGSTEILRAYLGSTEIYDATTPGGSTTYSLTGLGTISSTDNPVSIAVPAATLDEGDLVLVAISERSGVGTANNNMTTTAGTWTTILDHEQNLGDGSSRHSVCVHMHEATAGDESGLTLLGSTGAGGTGRRMSAFVIKPSATKSWTSDDVADVNSNTSDWNGLSSGSATASSGDSLIVGFACSRNDGTNMPTSVTLTQNDSKAEYGNSAANGLCHVMGISTSGQSAGGYSTTVTSNGSGNEGIAACLVFGG